MSIQASSKQSKITNVSEDVNRGYNILASTLLGVTALVYVGLIGVEPDPIDKIDNTLLVIVALVAVVWYFASGRKYRVIKIWQTKV